MMEVGFVKGQSENLPKIDSIMVAGFFANNPHFTSLEMRGVKTKSSGRENYGDAAIGYVQLCRRDKMCTIKTKICPEHKVRSKNYLVVIEVDEEMEKIVRAECEDCAASAGGCKHAVAVVMWLHRRREEPAPTETICYWKKSRLSSVGTSMKFLTTTAFGKVEHQKVDINFIKGSFLEEFVKNGKDQGISTQLLKYFPEQDNLNNLGMHQLLCDFVKEVQVTNSENFMRFARQRMSQEACDAACHATVEQSDSKLWYELRYGRLRASKIYEAARCKTVKGTFVETVIGALKIKETAPMRRGKLLEKKVLGVLAKQLKTSCHDVGLLLTPDHVILGASPDSISDTCVIELKCPSSAKTMDNYFYNNIIKNKYKAQIQQHMYIFKKSRGIFCVADPQFESNEKIHIYMKILICILLKIL